MGPVRSQDSAKARDAEGDHRQRHLKYIVDPNWRERIEKTRIEPVATWPDDQSFCCANRAYAPAF